MGSAAFSEIRMWFKSCLKCNVQIQFPAFECVSRPRNVKLVFTRPASDIKTSFQFEPTHRFSSVRIEFKHRLNDVFLAFEREYVKVRFSA